MTGSHEVRGSIPLGSTKIIEGLVEYEALELYKPHLNRKFARWIVPSFNSTTNCRQVPAHEGSVFQT